MQVQIKRQVKIELDQADITEAVRDFLADSGYSISAEDLAKITFVKSPKDGLRAELNITEETVSDEEPSLGEQHLGQTEPLVGFRRDADGQFHQVTVTREEPVTHEDGDQEAPGEVATSTVEDVTTQAVDAAVDEVIERAFTPDPVEESEDEATEAEPEAPSVAARNSLFN